MSKYKITMWYKNNTEKWYMPYRKILFWWFQMNYKPYNSLEDAEALIINHIYGEEIVKEYNSDLS